MPASCNNADCPYLGERFVQGYSVKVTDTHGIVYTPLAIVDFMYASVAEGLQTEFGLTLSSSGLNFLSSECNGFVTMQSHPAVFFGIMVQNREALIVKSSRLRSNLRGLYHGPKTTH